MSYVGRTYTKYTAELMQAVRDLELVDPIQPVVPNNPTNVVAVELWKLEIWDHCN